MVQGWGARAPSGTGVGRKSSRCYRGGERELPVVQGVVGRVPGGTGCGWESSRWYRGEGVKRESRACSPTSNSSTITDRLKCCLLGVLEVLWVLRCYFVLYPS